MKSGNSYLIILSLFSAFLIVSTIQLGKSRTTIDVLSKKNTTVSLQAEYPNNKLAIESYQAQSSSSELSVQRLESTKVPSDSTGFIRDNSAVLDPQSPGAPPVSALR